MIQYAQNGGEWTSAKINSNTNISLNANQQQIENRSRFRKNYNLFKLILTVS